MNTINDKILELFAEDVTSKRYRSELVYCFYKQIGKIYGGSAWTPLVRHITSFTPVEHIIKGELGLPFRSHVLGGVFNAVLGKQL